MAQNENYSQVDLRVGTEAQFNAKVDTLPAGTLFGVTDATVSKADLSTDLKNEINGKITQPSNPTGDSAVVIDSNGVVSTKLLSDIGSGITVDSELSDSSENPVQNKVISSALNSKVNNTTTVNGHALSSNVTVTKSDIGLGNVNNTSDANKPISNATQAALNRKQNTLSAGTNIDITNNTISTKNVPTLNGNNTFTGSNTFSGSGDPQVVFQGDNGSVILETTPGNSNITITIPNAADGTLALLSDIPTIRSTDDFAKKSSSNTFTQQNTFQAQTNFKNYALYNPGSSNYGFTYQCNGNVNNEVEIYGGDGTSTKGRVVVHGGNNAYHKTEYRANEIRLYYDSTSTFDQLVFPSGGGVIAVKSQIKPIYRHIIHLTRTNTTVNTGFSVYATIYTSTKTKITDINVLTNVLGNGNWVACNGYLTDGTYDVVMTLGTTYIRPLKAADVSLVNNVNWDDTVVEL